MVSVHINDSVSCGKSQILRNHSLCRIYPIELAGLIVSIDHVSCGSRGIGYRCGIKLSNNAGIIVRKGAPIVGENLQLITEAHITVQVNGRKCLGYGDGCCAVCSTVNSGNDKGSCALGNAVYNTVFIDGRN